MWASRQTIVLNWRQSVADGKVESQPQFRDAQRELDRATKTDLANGKGGRKPSGAVVNKGTRTVFGKSIRPGLTGGNATFLTGGGLGNPTRSRPGDQTRPRSRSARRATRPTHRAGGQRKGQAAPQASQPLRRWKDSSTGVSHLAREPEPSDAAVTTEVQHLAR